MQSTEERLQALENRIEALEREVLTLKQGVMLETGGHKMTEKPVFKQAESSAKGTLKQMTAVKSVPKTDKLREAFLGKYLVGALAALLIFTGTASFIGLIWRFLSPEVKLSFMSLVSLFLSGIGLWRVQKKKTPIAAVTLGIGAGLSYITIISANLAFHKIGNELTLVLAGIWSLVFMLSSRYSSLFFTLVIAQMGSFITLLLGLSYMEQSLDFTLLTGFNVLISGVMIGLSRNNRPAERLEVFGSVLLSFSVLLIGWFTQFMTGNSLLNDAMMPLVVNLALFIGLNAIFDLSKQSKAQSLTLLPALLTMVMTALNLVCLNEAFFNWEPYLGLSLFFAVVCLQMGYSQWRHKPLESKLTVFFVLCLTLTGMLLALDVYETPTGLVVIGVLVLALERLLESKHQGILLSLLLGFDGLLLALTDLSSPLFLAIGFMQLGLMAYVLWYNQQLSGPEPHRLMKGLALVFMVFSSVALARHLTMLAISNVEAYVFLDLSFLLMLTFMALLWRVGFFSEVPKEEASGKTGFMRTAAYALTTGLYFYGILLLNITDSLALKFVVTLGLTALALAQSWLFISGRQRQNGIVGFWLVFKYLLLIWAVILSFADLGVASAIYSVSGLVVAILSISVGFKLSIKSIRLYGLVLTVMMVAKFILVDLSQENSIVRVLALVLGGSLCFLISYIYNRLSENPGSPE